MDSSAFRGLGELYKLLFVWAVLGVLAGLVGLGCLVWIAFTSGGWWAHLLAFLAGYAFHAGVAVWLNSRD